MYYFLLSLLLFSCSVFADIYQARDADGVTVFSDIPRPDAQLISLGQPQTYMPATNSSSKKFLPNNNSAPTHTVSAAAQVVSIVNLKDGATVRNNNAIPFIIKATIRPHLAADQKAVLYLDDHLHATALKESNTTVKFIVKGLNRGEHQLQVRVVSKKDAIVSAQSKVLTIYFQQNKSSRLK